MTHERIEMSMWAHMKNIFSLKYNVIVPPYVSIFFVALLYFGIV